MIFPDVTADPISPEGCCLPLLYVICLRLFYTVRYNVRGTLWPDIYRVACSSHRARDNNFSSHTYVASSNCPLLTPPKCYLYHSLFSFICLCLADKKNSNLRPTCKNKHRLISSIRIRIFDVHKNCNQSGKIGTLVKCIYLSCKC